MASQAHRPIHAGRSHRAVQADPLIAQALRELRECLGQPLAGSDKRTPAFTIKLTLGGADTDKLGDLKNADQAYRIVPAADGRGLRLVAGTPNGLYYAVKTLQQLIRALGSYDGNVTIPAIEVTDWPDLTTRGIWGVDAASQVRWLSDRKFNYMEQIASSSINEQKKPVARLSRYKQQMVEDGPTHGISPVPAILHLEQISGAGLFKHYPELKGQGEGIHKGAICYADPLFTDILAEWMVGYLNMPGVREVDVWMAENLRGMPGCRCDSCKWGTDRDLMEFTSSWPRGRRYEKAVPEGRKVIPF